MFRLVENKIIIMFASRKIEQLVLISLLLGGRFINCYL